MQVSVGLFQKVLHPHQEQMPRDMSRNFGSYQSIVLRCGVAQAWNSFRHARTWYGRKFCVFDVPGTIVQNALFGGFLGLTLCLGAAGENDNSRIYERGLGMYYLSKRLASRLTSFQKWHPWGICWRAPV